MKVANAIKMLEKHGKVEQFANSFGVTGRFSAVVNGYVVSFIGNGGPAPENNITCIRARRENDLDDSQSDYTAGSFFDSLTAAIKYVTRKN